MTNAEIIQAIKAEVERRMKEYDAIIANQATSMRAERSAWKWAECKSLLSFLDTLQDEQPSKDLEEAAKQFVGYDMDTDNLRDYEVGIQAFIAGAKWQAEHTEDYPMPEDTVIFQKGVAEGKRLMMEEAIEGEISLINVGDDSYAKTLRMSELRKAIQNRNLCCGKVKVIIIKDDENNN